MAIFFQKAHNPFMERQSGSFVFLSQSPLLLPPSPENIGRLERLLLHVFFPISAVDAEAAATEAGSIMLRSVASALHFENPERSEEDCSREARRVMDIFLASIPRLKELLSLDAQAGFEGDPAARSVREVVLCYPALRTLVMHRTAHLLFQENIPLVPRMMNEVMHSRTGIDIHPGAKIGESFFIDHGTGVVIGETSVIGNHVKLYQGVTLGALSIPKKGCGVLLEGAKRHPTLEDNVTVYANATILGDITVGHDSIIASSAWIKDDIPPCSMVIMQRPDVKVRPLRMS